MAEYSKGLVTAKTPADLASAWVSELPEGTAGFVVSTETAYTLVKNIAGALPVPTDAILPAAGAARAGATGAFWVPGGAGSTVPVGSPTAVPRPGDAGNITAVVVTPASSDELMELRLSGSGGGAAGTIDVTFSAAFSAMLTASGLTPLPFTQAARGAGSVGNFLPVTIILASPSAAGFSLQIDATSSSPAGPDIVRLYISVLLT